MLQLPPLSHWASLSQTEAGAALAVPAAANVAPTASAPATARRSRLRPLRESDREVIFPSPSRTSELNPLVSGLGAIPLTRTQPSSNRWFDLDELLSRPSPDFGSTDRNRGDWERRDGSG